MVHFERSLAKFIDKMCDSNRSFTCLGHLGWHDTEMIISTFVTSLKEAKAKYSSDGQIQLSLAFFALKILPKETRLK
jgi:hypothetical protein